MMYWYGSGMGTWGYVLMTLSMIVFWGLLIAGVVVLVAVGNRRLMQRERVDLGVLAPRGEELAAGGRTVVIAAVDGGAARPAGALSRQPRRRRHPSRGG